MSRFDILIKVLPIPGYISPHDDQFLDGGCALDERDKCMGCKVRFERYGDSECFQNCGVDIGK